MEAESNHTHRAVLPKNNTEVCLLLMARCCTATGRNTKYIGAALAKEVPPL